MGGESKKRRLTHFTRPKPGTLGRMWQQVPQEDQRNDGWLVDEQQAHEKPTSQKANWQALPPLPKWPPLAEEDPFAPGRLREDTSVMEGGIAPPGEELSPLWERPEPDTSRLPNRPPSVLWQRFRSLSRNMQIGIVGAISAVLLFSILGAVALGHAFQGPSTATATVPAGNAGGLTLPTVTESSTVTAADATATASAAATPTTSPAPPFVLTFTCASGAIGGTGRVCVHTLPNAVISLAVRYCDGSYAGGKGLRGTAHTDGSGNYTWRWNIPGNTCAGTATATVIAKSGGQTSTQSTTFTVTG